MKRQRRRSALCAALLLVGGTAGAKDIHLIAAPTTLAMPDGVSVPLWGFAEDGNRNGVIDNGERVTVPGPAIQVPHDDPGLRITLHNQLPVAVSIVIPGQTDAPHPQFTGNDPLQGRAWSFTRATSPGASRVYTWNNLRPGSQVYHSGTRAQTQVPMGLYGALVKDSAAGLAYAGVPYDREAVILFSEVDPTLNNAVANGTYGKKGQVSAVDFRAAYFLVNGAPYRKDASLPIDAGRPGERTLLRLFNLGLTTHVPLLLGDHVQVVAEDGFPYPYPRRQYSVHLGAGTSRDALFTPTAAGLYPLFDRMLDLTNGKQPDGGMLAMLAVIDPNSASAPVAATDVAWLNLSRTTQVRVDLTGNDTDIDGRVIPGSVEITTPPSAGGTASNNGDGSVTYTPPTNFIGRDTFRYTVADDMGLRSAPGTVKVEVVSGVQ